MLTQSSPSFTFKYIDLLKGQFVLLFREKLLNKLSRRVLFIHMFMFDLYHFSLKLHCDNFNKAGFHAEVTHYAENLARDVYRDSFEREQKKLPPQQHAI